MSQGDMNELQAQPDRAQPEERQVIETSAFEDQDETMDGAVADEVDVQERILHQMLARRRRDEREGHSGLHGEGDQDGKGRPFLGELMQEASKRRRIGEARPGQPVARPG